MEPEASSVQSIFRLFRDGHRLESLLTGWRYDEARIARALIEGWRAGEKVDPAWVCPSGIKDLVLQTLRERPDLGPVEVSSLFKGKISPTMVRVLKETSGADRGLETALFTEQDYAERFHDDLHGAKRRILIVVPEVKSRHYRTWLTAFRRVIVEGNGEVAFFSKDVSHLVREEIEEAGIVLIEQHTHASLVLVDDTILWEGSLNFLAPSGASEHLRRTVSRLQCSQIRDLHDLYL